MNRTDEVDSIEKILNDQTKNELAIVAKKLRISGYSRLNKPELIEVILQCDQNALKSVLFPTWWQKHSVLSVLTWVGCLCGVVGCLVVFWPPREYQMQVASNDGKTLESLPTVKFVMPGEYHTPSKDDADDYYSNFKPAFFPTAELGVIRNFGPGPVFDVRARWLDANGTDQGYCDIIPMRDLAEGEFAKLRGLPTYLDENHESDFTLPGFIEIEFGDRTGQQHKFLQLFRLENSPKSEPQFRTILYLPDEQRSSKSVNHVHIR